MTYGHRKGHSKRMQAKRAEAAEKKLADWIISVQVLENGARFYKLKPGPAIGCECLEKPPVIAKAQYLVCQSPKMRLETSKILPSPQ